jgi:hypothetical protein
MRIDVHAHLWTDEYLDLLVRYGKTSAEEHRGLGADVSARDLDARFGMMDAAGVDRAVDYVMQSGLSEQDSVRILDTNAAHVLGLDPA